MIISRYNAFMRGDKVRITEIGTLIVTLLVIVQLEITRYIKNNNKKQSILRVPSLVITYGRK